MQNNCSLKYSKFIHLIYLDCIYLKLSFLNFIKIDSLTFKYGIYNVNIPKNQRLFKYIYMDFEINMLN